MAVDLNVICKDGVSGAEKVVARRAVECSALRYQKHILKNRIAQLEEELESSKKVLADVESKIEFVSGDIERLITELYIEKVES